MAILNQQRQSQNADFPNVRPSLDLRFALAKKLDPRITFTRASTGTYVDSDGYIKTAIDNQPRFDHDPITGECKGLLIEGSSTNLCPDSNGVYFFSTDMTITSEKAPDGSGARLCIPNSSGDFHGASGLGTIDITSLAVGVTTTVTYSMFAKDYNQSNMRILIGFTATNSSIPTEDYHLTIALPATGTFSGTPGGAGWTSVNLKVDPYPNGWYRFIVTGKYTKQSGYNSITFVGLQIFNRAGEQFYKADGQSGVYIWGVQYEGKEYATSHIPTSGGQKTRSADLVSMTGTNFSSWYNQTEGTVFINTRGPQTPIFPALYFIIFGINQNNKISIEQNSENNLIYLIINSSGTIQSWSASALPLNANRKSTFAYSSSNNNTLLSATSNQSYISNIISSADVYKPMDTILIGRYNDSLYFLDGTISRLTYYPIKLTDQQLINLTS